MTLFAALANPILPIFAILGFGFLLGRARLVTVDEARTVNRVVMTILVPIVVFDLLINAPIDAFTVLPMVLYSGTQAVIFALGYQLARRVFGAAPAEAVVLAYAGIFANTVFYSLPISLLLFGEDDILPVTMVVVLDSVVSFSGVMIVLQIINEGRASPLSVLRIFGRTPALLAIVAGLGAAILHVAPPVPLQTFLDFNGAAAAPVALLALGVILSGTRFTADAAVAGEAAVVAGEIGAAIDRVDDVGVANLDSGLQELDAVGDRALAVAPRGVAPGVPVDRPEVVEGVPALRRCWRLSSIHRRV